MNKCVVRQAIKQPDGKTFGYELLFSMKNELYNQSGDYAIAETISTYLLQNGSKIATPEIIFMTFTPNLLFKNTARIFRQQELVIQIEDNVVVHPLSQRIIQRYRENGYKFCINEFQFIPRYFALLEYVDYIKINVQRMKAKDEIQNLLNLAAGFGKICILTGIDDKETYEFAKQFDVELLQGSFVAEAMTTKADKSEYLQSNFFQLVVAVTQDEPDIEQIEQIITRDASLTYTLLRMVNSVHYALRHRTASVKQALMVLGLNQLKQWVYLLSFDQIENDPASEEILRISFIRANFCSSLYEKISGLNITKSEAYLMGMFSTIEALVDAPAEEVIAEIPISDDVKNAIIRQEGVCGKLYQLMLFYEKADWKNLEETAEQLKLTSDTIGQVYLNCLEDVNDIWKNIATSEKQKEKEPEELQEQLQESMPDEYFPVYATTGERYVDEFVDD